MNIVVFSNKTGIFFFKPDNTLVRDSKDYYIPGFVTEISVALSVVVKISRSAKCTLKEYARRYYHEWGLGLVLYPDNILKAESTNLFSSGRALSLDNTTYEMQKLFPVDEIGKNGKIEFLSGTSILYCNTLETGFLEEIDKSIEEISRHSSLKNGDLIYIEVTERIPVNIGNNLKVSYSGQSCLDFCIK